MLVLEMHQRAGIGAEPRRLLRDRSADVADGRLKRHGDCARTALVVQERRLLPGAAHRQLSAANLVTYYSYFLAVCEVCVIAHADER